MLSIGALSDLQELSVNLRATRLDPRELYEHVVEYGEGFQATMFMFIAEAHIVATTGEIRVAESDEPAPP